MTEIFLGRPYGSGDSPRICSDLGRCYWEKDLRMEGTQEQSWYELLLIHQPVLEKKKKKIKIHNILSTLVHRSLGMEF